MGRSLTEYATDISRRQGVEKVYNYRKERYRRMGPDQYLQAIQKASGKTNLRR